MKLQALAALVLVMTAIVLGRTVVFGHSGYERSVPERNEVLPRPPAQVDMFFTQEVRKLEGANLVRVFDEAGEQVSEGHGVVDDDDRTHVYAEIPTQLSAGRYVVAWQSLSDEDGEEDEGALCFYVAVEPTAAQAEECAQFDAGATYDPATRGKPGRPMQLEATATDEPATPDEAMPEPTGVARSEGDDDGGPPTGAIVGGIIGGSIILGAVVGGGGAWLSRRRA